MTESIRSNEEQTGVISYILAGIMLGFVYIALVSTSVAYLNLKPYTESVEKIPKFPAVTRHSTFVIENDCTNLLGYICPRKRKECGDI